MAELACLSRQSFEVAGSDVPSDPATTLSRGRIANALQRWRHSCARVENPRCDWVMMQACRITLRNFRSATGTRVRFPRRPACSAG